MKQSRNRSQNPAIKLDAFDDYHYPRGDSEFSSIVETAFNRRDFIKWSSKIGLGAFLVGCSSRNPYMTAANQSGGTADYGRVQFTPIASGTSDTVRVPEEFDWDVVASWGDPLWSRGEAFDEKTGGTSTSQALAFGDNNDGMAMFETRDGSYILAVNNEYTNLPFLYANRASKLPENAEDVRKGMYAHGISLIEVERRDGHWRIVKDSPYNRRITPETPMAIVGPLRGYRKMKTKADPNGTRSLGTWNNCANGRTPWGTYLTCEENFNGYFSSSDASYKPTPEMQRYGIGNKDWDYAWGKYDQRFDISKNPNEPNRAGYVVEIDPEDPASTPKKLTALGRLKHENAELVIAQDGRVVVYMGDDERGEYLYRFVSGRKYSPDMPKDNNLLHDGTLYAARFYPSGKGEWLPLTPETTGMSKEEICLHTRMAASAVKATTMDRPEWVSASPTSLQVVCALTNNKNRGVKPNKGGDETPVGGPNPRAKNLYGQIVRWFPNKDHTANDFRWDLFAMAGNPTIHQDKYAGSANISPENMFNSPDGLAFDKNGNLWIQTDGNYSNEGEFAGMGNNQMLTGYPDSGEINRFLVGPKEAEVTGLTWSPDHTTLFVGIQHPGEEGNSHFPQGGNHVPRSSVIAVYRKDGKAIV